MNCENVIPTPKDKIIQTNTCVPVLTPTPRPSSSQPPWLQDPLTRAVPVPGAPSRPRKGKRPQPRCLPPGPPPGLPQTDSLSVVATVSHPVELGSLLGKGPPALCQGQHWPSVGSQQGCFPRGWSVVGPSGACAEPGLGPRSRSAADSLWGVKELSFGVFLKLYKSSRKMHSPYKIIA